MITEKQEFQFYIGNDIIKDKEKGYNKLFTAHIDFVKGIKSFHDMPSGDFIEICFSGRSNVGKSSLINSLLNRKNIARTSKKPGQTKTILF